MYTRFYDISKTDIFKDASSIFSMLPNEHKFLVERIVSKKIYAAIIFNHKVLSVIDSYCCKFFDCTDKGLSYELGCYFQNRKYESDGFIESDIRKFESLLKIYNASSYPNEFNLIRNLVQDLRIFLERWRIYEKYYPELFYV